MNFAREVGVLCPPPDKTKAGGLNGPVFSKTPQDFGQFVRSERLLFLLSRQWPHGGECVTGYALQIRVVGDSGNINVIDGKL